MVEIERLVNQAVLLVKPETIESKHAHLQSWSVKNFWLKSSNFIRNNCKHISC